jgi:hypothetical protein
MNHYQRQFMPYLRGANRHLRKCLDDLILGEIDVLERFVEEVAQQHRLLGHVLYFGRRWFRAQRQRKIRGAHSHFAMKLFIVPHQWADVTKVPVVLCL